MKFNNIKIGSQPIAWSNDDFHDLGGTTPLEQCLSEMREAGYSGTELGHKFPKDAKVLRPILDHHGMSLISGWHSTYILDRSPAEEKEDFLQHLDFLSQMGSKVVIVAECSGRNYHIQGSPLRFEEPEKAMTVSEWKRLGTGLSLLGELAEQKNMRLVYHHHMGTVVQTLSEIDQLMNETSEQWVSLLLDTGHLAFAGVDPMAVLRKYGSRIGHVHLKNIRPEIVRKAREGRYSFDRAVREGVFTVPGDGGLDYGPIFSHLSEINYTGWWVVEAEQDPAMAHPFQYAKLGRQYIYRMTGL